MVTESRQTRVWCPSAGTSHSGRSVVAEALMHLLWELLVEIIAALLFH